jgi:sec-independent protein translocase protein TatB
MLNIGAGEVIFILIAALLVLGPKRLPELARGIGKFVREFRRQTDEVRTVVEREFYKMDEEPPPVLTPPEGVRSASTAATGIPPVPPPPLAPAGEGAADAGAPAPAAVHAPAAAPTGAPAPLAPVAPVGAVAPQAPVAPAPAAPPERRHAGGGAGMTGPSRAVYGPAMPLEPSLAPTQPHAPVTPEEVAAAASSQPGPKPS